MSYNSIVSACPGIDVNSAEDCQFVVAQLQRGATEQEASAAWTATLKARTEIAREEAATAARENARVNSMPGVDPLEGGHRASGGAGDIRSATREFGDLVKEQMDRGYNRQKAVCRVVQDRPDLASAMRGE